MFSFGKSPTPQRVRASLIEIIRQNTALAEKWRSDMIEATGGVVSIGEAEYARAREQLPGRADKELTEKVMKDVGNDQKKSHELLDDLASTGLDASERVLYCSTVYYRALQIGPPCAILWELSGVELLDQTNQLVQELLAAQRSGTASTVAEALLKKSKDLHNTFIECVAQYFCGYSAYYLNDYRKARDAWQEAVRLMPAAKQIARENDNPGEVEQFDRMKETIDKYVAQMDNR